MSLSKEQLRTTQAVNQPRRIDTPSPTKTVKQDVGSRHQAPADVSVKTQDFGYTQIDPSIIEAQFIKGDGSFHPSNLEKLTLDAIQDEVDVLKRSLGPMPAAPTSYQLVGDRNQVMKPFDFYKKIGGKTIEPDCMNVLSIEQNAVSIEYFLESIIHKLSLDTTYHVDRAKGFIDYLKWAVDQLEKSLPIGEKHNKLIADWDQKKRVLTAVTKVMKDQANYDKSLTDQDRRVLIQEEERNNMKSTLQELVNETLIKAGVLPTPEAPKKRHRRTKAEIDAARSGKGESLI